MLPACFVPSTELIESLLTYPTIRSIELVEGGYISVDVGTLEALHKSLSMVIMNTIAKFSEISFIPHDDIKEITIAVIDHLYKGKEWLKDTKKGHWRIISAIVTQKLAAYYDGKFGEHYFEDKVSEQMRQKFQALQK